MTIYFIVKIKYWQTSKNKQKQSSYSAWWRQFSSFDDYLNGFDIKNFTAVYNSALKIISFELFIIRRKHVEGLEYMWIQN